MSTTEPKYERPGRRKHPPPSVEGVRVRPFGNAITAGDGHTWTKLVPYDDEEDRSWLFCYDTGEVTEYIE